MYCCPFFYQIFYVCRLNRHDMDLSTMFNSRPPLEDLKSKLMGYLQEKKADLRGTTEKVKLIEKEFASKEANRKMNL